jgi:hypothetical protein
MTRLPAPVQLDFAAPPPRVPLAGALLCAAGLAAAAAVGLAFQRTLAERNQLEAALEPLTHRPRHVAPSPELLKSAAEAATVQRELGTPWTRLLAELEDASRDSATTVSLLHVEPDASKQLVRITAEVRAFPDAVAYLKRLQKIAVLRFPTLESHERLKDDPQHPLRIKLSAEWRK